MTVETFLNGRVTLRCGDMLDVLAAMPENSVDSVVCDPPYHLASIVKRFGAEGAAPCKPGTDGAYGRASAGFMGKAWDGGDIAFRPDTWARVLRVLKPGGYMAAFAGTRGWHRMMCAIEDAGFEIRDSISYLTDGGLSGPLLWAYGSGFPKNHDISKKLRGDCCQCAVRAVEPEAKDGLRGVRGNGEDAATQQAQKTEAGVLRLFVPSQDGIGPEADPAFASGSIGLDGGKSRLLSDEDARTAQSGLERRGDAAQATRQLRQRPICEVPGASDRNGEGGRLRDGASAGDGRVGSAPSDADRVRASRGSRPAEQPSDELGTVAGQPKPQNGRAWPDCPRCGKPVVPSGLGTALKPAWEPIVLVRKPLAEPTIAANVLRWGTGAVNIDACRVDGTGNKTFDRGAGDRDREQYRTGTTFGSAIPSDLGRWPANLIHDGSDEVVEAFPAANGAVGMTQHGSGTNSVYGNFERTDLATGGNGQRDFGSAARFFFSAKADCRCGLCGSLLSAGEAKVSSCDANNAASILSTPNTPTANSVHCDAVGSTQQECEASSLAQSLNAQSAVDLLSASLPPVACSAPSIALAEAALKIGPHVKSAASLCDSCVTAIAQSLAATRLGHSQESVRFPGSMPERNARILRQSLALYVAGRESTDTIGTTASLRILFGSVFHAIAESISLEKAASAASSRPGPTRFHYSSKADEDERAGSAHPTVKPQSLLRYLTRLVTPKGGTVLDCFAGTGSTGQAAYHEGFSAALIEREPEYQADIRRRMALVLAGPDERRHAIIKAKGKPVDLTGTLFAPPMEAAE